jgi:hypothetical protein
MATDNKPARADLFKTYREQAGEIQAAMSAVDDLKAGASATIAQIVEHYGPGPYKLDGNLVKARKQKADLGGLYAFHEQSLEAEEV